MGGTPRPGAGPRARDVYGVKHTFLPQLRLSLLDSSHNHITHTSRRQSVQPRTDTLD